MSRGRVGALVLAVLLLVGGVFFLLAGNGLLGVSKDTSQGWASMGGVLAGLGVALAYIVLVQNRNKPKPDDAMARRYGK